MPAVMLTDACSAPPLRAKSLRSYGTRASPVYACASRRQAFVRGRSDTERRARSLSNGSALVDIRKSASAWRVRGRKRGASKSRAAAIRRERDRLGGWVRRRLSAQGPLWTGKKAARVLGSIASARRTSPTLAEAKARRPLVTPPDQVCEACGYRSGADAFGSDACSA
jgi:hypothetical protein